MSKIEKLADFYGGISNLKLQVDAFDFGEGIKIYKSYAHLMAPFIVALNPAPPGQHHPAPWVPSSGGFSFDIDAELFIPKPTQDKYADPRSLARSFLFLMKLGISPAICMPVVSSHSFQSLREDPTQQARIYPAEVEPRYFGLSTENDDAGEQALAWVAVRWRTVVSLLKGSPEFGLAVHAIEAGQSLRDTALTMMSLWGALEALFSPSSNELRFRISALIATYLEPPGKGRAQLQKKVAKLYDRRSAAAHGRPKHSQEDLLATFELLRGVLIKIIGEGTVPDKGYLERHLFGDI